MSTPEKLLDAAEYRMRRGGYNAVSFRDLANDTKIKSSSVNYHYPKKEDLGLALVERYAKKFNDGLEAKTKDAETTQDNLKAYQAVFRQALVEDDAVCLCGLLSAESAGIPESIRDRVQHFFTDNIRWLMSILPADMSESRKRTSANTLLAGHQGAMMLAKNMQDNAIFDSITDQLLEQVI